MDIELAWPVADVAEIVAVPAAIPVTSPAELTVATEELEEDQVTELVITDVVPSVKLPFEINCAESPFAIELDVAEVTDIALIFAGVPTGTTPMVVLIPFC